MKLSSLGPMTAISSVDLDRLDPPVRSNQVDAARMSHIESGTDNTNQAGVVAERLANIIEIAKKRASVKRKKGQSRRLRLAINTYQKIQFWDELNEEVGSSLDIRT